MLFNISSAASEIDKNGHVPVSTFFLEKTYNFNYVLIIIGDYRPKYDS